MALATGSYARQVSPALSVIELNEEDIAEINLPQ